MRRLTSRPSRAALALLSTGILAALATLPDGSVQSRGNASPDFVNFETLQVRPLCLTPDGSRLVALNTPDARVEIFAPGTASLVSLGEIPVGLEPVAVAARNDSIVWVVNHLSDDVCIVNLNRLRVEGTVRVGDAPTDVVFAGNPARAFVCVGGEDAVKIYSLTGDAGVTLDDVVPIPARHPRALAASGSEVAVAALDAGNRTTILSAAEVQAGGGPPPPNPPRTAPGDAPAVGLIVQKVGADWVDERPASAKTWNATIPYDMPDRDVTILDAVSGAVLRTVSDVGTNLLQVAAGPSGAFYVSNTEAFNRTRFEPNLRGRFAQNRISRVVGSSVTTWHLNAHIDYATSPGTPFEREQSLSQPMQAVVDAAEATLYVAALGSDKVGVVNTATGAVTNRIATSLQPKATRNGPTGLALDEVRGQLYVLNRFSNSVAILDPAGGVPLYERALAVSNGKAAVTPLAGFTPEDATITNGRRFLYDGSLSAHGDLACASCHIGGNLDNIAWDLGDPTGSPQPAPPQPLPLPPFDPMKGPMATQTLRGLPGTGPFHWRGDRLDFTRFNPAFVSLMGHPDTLTQADMQSYADFIVTLRYPPNPHQNLDRTWPDPPAPSPSPERGRNEFTAVPHDGGLTCATCHALPTGTNGLLIPGQALQESQAFKVPQLRNLYEKTGFRDAPGPVKRGFGFLHDGSIDDLFRFLQLPVFQFTSDQERRDLEAFLLAFDTGTAPSVGREVAVTGANKGSPAVNAVVDSLVAEAEVGQCDLIVHHFAAGDAGGGRGLLYRPGGTLESDYDPEGSTAETVFRSGLPAGDVAVYLGVPPGSGERMALDRDRDGFKDRWERALGSDPADPSSIPYVTAAQTSAPAPATRLGQNAPNPFNPSTVIPYEVGRPARVLLEIFDVQGRKVRTLVDASKAPGVYDARWDGRDDRGRALGSGRYYYRLRVGFRSLSRSLTILR